MRRILVTGPPLREAKINELSGLGFETINGTAAALEFLKVPQADRSRDLSEAELKTVLSKVEIYIYGGLEIATAAALEGATHLRLIGFLGTGWSDPGCVDGDFARSRGLLVTNTPGANAQSVAEATMAAILALQRQLVDLSNKTKRGEGRPVKTRDICGRRLGIIGLGQIGGRVARHAVNGFGMKVTYCGPHAKPELEKELDVSRIDFDDLLRTSDFISVHSPAKTTAGLIGERELSLMQETAYLINLSSTEIVDGPSIVKVLSEGRIAGAAFDGWYKHPPELETAFLAISDNRLIIFPRSVWLTDDSFERMTEMALASVRGYARGERPPHQVNP